MSKQAEFVLRTVREQGIRFIRLWFTDVQGFPKSVSIGPPELETAFSEGMTFDGSAIDGYARVQEADMLAQPDPSTFQLIPWRKEEPVGRMFCDIVYPDGTPFEGDPRTVLKRNLKKASDLGYTFYVSPELEFFLFRDSGPYPQVLDRGGYFDLTPSDVTHEYRRQAINNLEQIGIPVEHSHHEVAPSQHEIIIRYTDALTMADNIMTFRLTVKEVAVNQGVHATFMPKPLEHHDGSAMHLHLSLFRGEENVFADPSLENGGGLSEIGEKFIAGLLHHAPEMTAITNQWINSYKRLVPGFEAPIYVSWARNNQSALVRIPTIKTGKRESVRVEYRSPDAACNPYLVLSVLLAAGMEGIKQEYPLPTEVTHNIYQLTPKERDSLGISRLPSTLEEALRLLDKSELVRGALGDHVVDWFLRNKQKECEEYHQHVTRFELERYLPVL